ncbi:sporulation membrane protein YtaF [Sporohalobacter salinus]|uniref:sporulation membrane protein YtaF n=1 Tax=Sporohalobacter salinus TaxID=1494606 RepID=UPI00195FF26A|nr:sporulation membrane protein YtaF [Sporohalobacter salinus]MBM7624621.1 putative sporulation protein YtaF [Sporohalobacter salinus]
MKVISILLLALAISFDGLVVGITYGLRKIKIPLLSLIIISLTSAISVLVSMLFGQLITNFLSIKITKVLGGSILILVGIWILYQSVRQILIDKTASSNISVNDNSASDQPLFDLKIKSLGIVIKILKEPVKADFDYSGIISKKEAVFLGFALALDGFGAGIGAAMTGFSPVFTAIIAGVVILGCLSLGLYLGGKYNLKETDYRIALLPGLLLIILGIVKLF